MHVSKSPFSSSKRSLARARHHIENVKDIIEALNNDDTCIYEIVKQAYGDRRRFVVKARLTREIPEEVISVIVDAVYNLRASIDQSIYSVAELLNNIKNSKINWSEIKFPVDQSEGNYKKKLDNLSNLQGMPREIIDEIERHKPYGERASPILSLNKLANTNKHRYLVEHSIRADKFRLVHLKGPKTIGNLDHFELGGGGHTVTTVPSDAPVDNSLEIGLYISAYKPMTIYEVEISINIAFRGIGGIDDKSCVFHLEKMLSSCEQLNENFIRICQKEKLL